MALEKLHGAIHRFRAPLSTPRLGPCVGAVGKIIGVGLNYRDHAAEANMPIPEEPPAKSDPP